MQEGLPVPEKQFSSTEEEVSYLRERLAHAERERAPLARAEETPAEQVVREYAAAPTEAVLPEARRISPEASAEAITLTLSPEAHDANMEELVGILREKGVKNALSVVEKTNDAHLIDDFHRFLVAYIHGGYDAVGLKEHTPLWKDVHMTLFEVTVPASDEGGVTERASAMEQFYAGMRSLADKSAREHTHMSLEIAQGVGQSEVSFFVAVPDAKKALFEKQLLATFSKAHVIEHQDDYNIFNQNGVATASRAALRAHTAFPLASLESFTTDPLNIVLNTFASLADGQEGAAVQFVITPAPESVTARLRKALGQVQKGVQPKEALKETTVGTALAGLARDLVVGAPKKKPDTEALHTPPDVDQEAVSHLQEKLSAPLYSVVIRIFVSAPDEARAASLKADIESAFHQFERPGSNTLTFAPYAPRSLMRAHEDFTFRRFSQTDALTLNAHELSALAHFPASTSTREAAPHLKQARAGTAPAPVSLPAEGTLLGTNQHRGVPRQVFLGLEDRMRHVYCIGQTGTGKTTLLKNMIVQDIRRGDGVCMIDPHGSDVDDVLGLVPPERADDVIYFDPAHTARPMGLNMLEYDPRHPEQKSFVVDEMLSVFNKLFDMKTAGGPLFEQYFRNAVLLAIDDATSGATLLDVSRVLSDQAFREAKLSASTNPVVVQFWRGVAEKAGGEASLANVAPYITSKFDAFLTNEIMRPIVAQAHSSFNFREVMDSRKILLINLSKGRLGELNAHLLGLIIVGKILLAALSRVDTQERPDFHLYIDEFQNVTTDSIATIFSEARKYRLSLTVAHQFIAQLDESIKTAVFGNVGSLAAFRVGADDAAYLEQQFAPTFSTQDILQLDNFNAYVRLLADGVPSDPFNLTIVPPEKPNAMQAQTLKARSFEQFGKDRTVVEQEIAAYYQEAPSPQSPDDPPRP